MNCPETLTRLAMTTGLTWWTLQWYVQVKVLTVVHGLDGTMGNACPGDHLIDGRKTDQEEVDWSSGDSGHRRRLGTWTT
ncbi:hypothetical protein NP493_3037g00000 [Ridgeia piscesae]|uniref:Uncharacterized protein n=1 Tax=Ridgeia piscesae TaxID=27915 RepID=A0AAD9JAI8_RIDPI|nr:hypothetical protein NP493_3037g00000 [Ridgeia piscesae]